jgi:hypothetical protein
MGDYAEFEEGTEFEGTEEEWEGEMEKRDFYFNEDEEDLSTLLRSRSSEDVTVESSPKPSFSPSPPSSPSPVRSWAVRVAVVVVVVAVVVVGLLVGTSRQTPPAPPFSPASPQVIVGNLGMKKKYSGNLRVHDTPVPPHCRLNHMEFLSRHAIVYVHSHPIKSALFLLMAIPLRYPSRSDVESFDRLQGAIQSFLSAGGESLSIFGLQLHGEY